MLSDLIRQDLPNKLNKDPNANLYILVQILQDLPNKLNKDPNANLYILVQIFIFYVIICLIN